MEIHPSELGRILDAIEQIREHLARLESRVVKIESTAGQRGAVPEQESRPASEQIDPETMMSIGAALAAYLGKRPRIRSIRLLRTDAWTQQGRTTLQAIHGQRRPNERQ
ncbi:MAG: hypothetical protein ACOCTG_05745 [Bacteroidota bacterium]